MSQPHTIDEVPEEFQAAYYSYINDSCGNSEKILSGADWLEWHLHGTGKAEKFEKK